MGSDDGGSIASAGMESLLSTALEDSFLRVCGRSADDHHLNLTVGEQGEISLPW